MLCSLHPSALFVITAPLGRSGFTAGDQSQRVSGVGHASGRTAGERKALVGAWVIAHFLPILWCLPWALGPPPCSEATFQDENRPGLGFTGAAPPDLACSEWNSVMGSDVTLSPLEQA